jgi:hypothetical protein
MIREVSVPDIWKTEKNFRLQFSHAKYAHIPTLNFPKQSKLRGKQKSEYNYVYFILRDTTHIWLFP